MLLTINIGNTYTTLSVYRDEKQAAGSSVASDCQRTVDEYAAALKNVLNLNGVAEAEIDGCMLSSVVPALTPKIKAAILKLTGVTPVVVGPGVKTGFPLRIDQQTQLGGDIVACVAGALSRYKAPLIVIYFGTAITLSVINSSGAFLGTAIAPGLQLSLDALSQRTAQLPHLTIGPAEGAIGRNTEASMTAGVILGCASMVDGMVERMAEELGAKPNVVATGSMAELVAPYCKMEIATDPQLLHDGLRWLYHKSREGGASRRG